MLPSMKVCKNIVKMSLQVNTFKRKFENKKAMTYVRINKSHFNTVNEAVGYELLKFQRPNKRNEFEF